MPKSCFGKEELQNLKEFIETQDSWGWSRSNFVPRFANAFGTHLGRKYIHTVNSGTSALLTAYASLGLNLGDEILCPAVAPIFVSFPVVALGGIPVFCDVDPRTQIISPEAIEDKITARTRAITVVHLYGQPAMMNEILAIARKYNLKVIEDCAQAYDATYKGQKVGTLGDLATFSLQQSKHITAGEGGIIATDDITLYKRMVEFSNSGMPTYGYGIEPPKALPMNQISLRGHFSFGLSLRFHEILAAIALAQLEKIDDFNLRRKRLVEKIEHELNGVPGVRLAHVYPDTQPNYWQYPVWGPELLGSRGQINYLEVEFQRMQKTRHTSFGVPLPEYVQYVPGSCPEAEHSTLGAWTFFVHQSVTDEELENAIDYFFEQDCFVHD